MKPEIIALTLAIALPALSQNTETPDSLPTVTLSEVEVKGSQTAHTYHGADTAVEQRS